MYLNKQKAFLYHFIEKDAEWPLLLLKDPDENQQRFKMCLDFIQAICVDKI